MFIPLFIIIFSFFRLTIDIVKMNVSSKKNPRDSSSDSDDHDSGSERKRKKITYEHKFQMKWLNDKRFSPWIIQSKKCVNKPYCTACELELSGSVTLLERHVITEKHKKNVLSKSQSKKVTSFFQPNASRFDRQVAAAELKMCAFVAEHNLPTSIMDHLPGLVANVSSDSKVAGAVKCGRTKATAIFKNVLGNTMFSDLVLRLKNTKFSLIIDESTDLSTVKHLVLIVRFYDQSVQKTCDEFLSLIEVKDCTAQGLYSSIVNFFDEHGISFDNLIGFASDNASVMMGEKSGVKALIQKRIPALFVQGCVCHSLALVASYACCELPNNIEELARSIYSYIMNSPKRLSEYAEFQQFTEVQPHRILHPSCTRWLSLEEVVKRILEQWNALTLYFTSATLEDGMVMASVVLQELQNPVTKMYFAFLAFILPAVNKLNLDFQATALRIHRLCTSLSNSLKGILANYMKPEKLKNRDLTQINVNDPSSYLSLGDIYRGARVESIYLEHCANIPKRELEQFQVKTLNFYVALSKQMMKRFLSHNMFKNLQLLEALDPVNVCQGKPKSLIPLAVKFPNIVDENVYEDLNSEWRELSVGDIAVKLKDISDEPETFWYNVSRENCGDKPRYPNVSKLMLNLMSLPHSSAAAERIFSLVTNIKTKNRNRLKTDTLNGLIHSKSLLHGVNSKTWQPPPQLVDTMSKKWSTATSTSSVEASQDTKESEDTLF